MTAATDHTPGYTSDPAQQNLFGICARIGEDFGFNPLWLRIGFATVLILNPVAVIAAYFALGAVVLTSRIVFPQRTSRPSARIATLPTPAAGHDAEVRLPLAA